MKKITIILAALAAAFAVSCTKETPETQTPQDSTVPAGMKLVTISASIEGADTKTSYDADGKFSWTKGDQISVLAGEQFYTFTADQTGSSSTFTGYIPEDSELGSYAFYPADANHHYESWTPYFHLPEYKDLTGKFSADIPMGAKGADGKYAFTHVTGALYFTFSNIPEDIASVEISVKNSDLKFTGDFSAYGSGTGLSWNYSNPANDSEKTFTRKVDVVDNSAHMYLPYRGTLWNGYTYTIDVVGYDAEGASKVLLDGKNMPGKDKAMAAAEVYPVAPLVLNNLANVDWENALTSVVDPSAEYSRLKELKVHADEYYMYVRLTPSITAPFDGDYLDIFLSDGEGESKAWYGWTTTGTDIYNVGLSSHRGEVDKTTAELTKMRFILPDNTRVYADVKTEVSGEDVYWYMVYPREYLEPYVSSTGKVYVSFMLWNAWDPYGVIPAMDSSMLEVTLP